MAIRSWEAINALLACLFLVGVFRRDIRTPLFLLFVYGSLHFSYAAMPMLAGASAAEVKIIHFEGSGLLAKLSASLVLATMLLRLILADRPMPEQGIGLRRIFLTTAAVLVVGYAVNLRPHDWLQFRNIAATAFMLAMLLLLSGHPAAVWEPGRKVRQAMLAISAGMLGIAFYELYALRAWAWFYDSWGETIYRASSLLFNPNLYALWCVSLALVFAYLFHRDRKGHGLMLMALAMSMAGLYLSGSRGLAIVLLVLLAGAALMLSDRPILQRWAPAATMPAVFLFLGLVARAMSGLPGEQGASWHAIALLGERFALLPAQLGNYVLGHLHLPSLPVPVEVAVSIEGRFEGALRDSGWLVVYDDAGWLGAAAMLGLWAYFGYMGVRAYLRNRDVASVYALAALVLSVATGVLMRFQAFPTGLFVVLMLAPCLSYWRTVSAERAETERDR